MWVISRGFYLGVLVLSFISVLLFQLSGHCCLFLLFSVCVCVLFAFILQMFSVLLCGRIFGLRFPRDPVLYNPLQVLFRMLCWLAASTSSKYFSSYNRWRSWAWENGLTVFPASPVHFAIYLRHLMTEAKTASPLESAVHSIAWFHQLGGEPSPSDHPLVKSSLAGAQRLLAHQTTKKEPITVSQLEQLVASKADSMASLYNIRSVVICLLAYLLPFSDLMSLLSLFDPMLRSKMTC